jgi:hypothetical protein
LFTLKHVSRGRRLRGDMAAPGAVHDTASNTVIVLNTSSRDRICGG